MSYNDPFTRRTLLKTAGGLALVSGLSAPSILRAQSADVIRIGHLTPRTGFLGPLGEYAVMAVDLAVEEINASGGMMGRKVELLKEDSVNPQTASTKAERMIERDKVACIIGEISSASCLTISQVAARINATEVANASDCIFTQNDNVWRAAQIFGIRATLEFMRKLGGEDIFEETGLLRKDAIARLN